MLTILAACVPAMYDASTCPDTWAIWYADQDGDGFGNPLDALGACSAPEGYVADFRDCDDGDPGVNPDAADDDCDGRDQDCDQNFDDHAPLLYADEDGDGYGRPFWARSVCYADDTYVDNDLDCDDSHADAHPGGEDVCGDRVDGDCDGIADLGCGGPIVADVGAVGVTIEQPADLGTYTRFGAAVALGPRGLLVGAPGADAAFVYHAPVLGDPPDATIRSWVAYAGSGVAWAPDLAGADRIAIAGNGLLYFVDADVTGEVDGDDAGAWIGDVGDLIATATNLDGEGTSAVLNGGGADGYVTAWVVTRPSVGDEDISTQPGVRMSATSGGWGVSLADAGDVDGDGIDDVIVGDFARFAVQPGPVTELITEPDQTVTCADCADLSIALAGPGDVDGDGLDDVVTGGIDDETGLAVAWLFTNVPSVTTSADARVRVMDTECSIFLGSWPAVTGVGDVDGDDRADFALGDDGCDLTMAAGGAAWIISGAPEGTLDAEDIPLTLLGGVDDFIGTPLAGGEDISGDGLPDLVVGELYNGGSLDARGAFVVSPADWIGG